MQSQEREPDFTLTGVDLSIDQLISRVDQEHRIILDYLDRGLTNIPARIGSLSSLQLLHLSKNKLSRLPPEFSSLRIRRLDLSNNLFDTMPPEVFSLSCLETLDLSGNNIQFIPPDISKLTTLKVLNLTSNKIAALPPELFLLPNLHTLYLGSNKISIVPSDIHLCSRLKVLHLDGNALTSLPDVIGDLTSLSELSLARNQLTSLPDRIGDLAGLEALSIDSNQLAAVPETLSQLRNLRELYLSNNHLSTLPPTFATILENGTQLHLDGNDWEESLGILVRRGREAVLTYLRSLLDGVPCYEAKILVVGEGNRGKSSLVAALKGEPFLSHRSSTHGLQIGTLKVPHPSLAVDISLNTWDFGGQDLYRATQQFFFSPRSLYLVVWKPREGVDDNSIEQWLTQIRLRVSDARVILVSTYCNDSRPDLDYGHLKERFGSILEGSFEVDNSDGTGIPELLEAITSLAARLPQVGSMISRRWLAARHDLLALQAAEISRAAFDDICEQHRMTQREGQTLLELLHDLGAIIYYGNDEGLRDVIVLQPEWLTKAISYVLLDRQTLNSNGELEHSRLLQIWKDHGDPTRESYPERYHPYFLRLMEKFDISYRLQDEPRSLVGQMVPTQKPQLPWESSSELNRGDRELALKCSMSDVPPGLVAWLTVRNHRFSTQRHWKRGVFLAHQSCEGLLELCGQLSITVRGPSPDYFFSLLRDSLEYLVEQRWPGLVYEFQVPCRHYNKERKRCEGAFKFSSLLAARLRGIVKIQCHDCFSECDVGELLTGFATAKEPVEQKLDEILRIQKRSAAFQRQTATTQNQAAAEIRKMLTMLSAENRDCPHLFWLARSDRAGWKRLFSTEYLLQLYCEEPEKQHPVDAVYTISRSDDWLLRIAPYASLVIKILKVAAPLAAPLVEMTASASVADTEKPRLDLMEKVIGDFADQIGHDSTITVGDTGLTALQGSGLRAFHALLLAVDPQRKWGDLRRVQSASKDFLWVCPYHYKQYDPGLPILLYRRT